MTWKKIKQCRRLTLLHLERGEEFDEIKQLNLCKKYILQTIIKSQQGTLQIIEIKYKT